MSIAGPRKAHNYRNRNLGVLGTASSIPLPPSLHPALLPCLIPSLPLSLSHRAHSDRSRRYPTSNYQTDIIGNISVDWLRYTRDRSKPFFLMLTPHAPHEPYAPAPRHKGKLKGLVQPPDPSFNMVCFAPTHQLSDLTSQPHTATLPTPSARPINSTNPANLAFNMVRFAPRLCPRGSLFQQ